ncbi:MAG: calcium-binding protein [Candidatus Nitrosocosmicus sp.]|nr:calcium-binding protein [Candidatus Nitrosocosmicus sp.]MDN5867078.1 calcium-binding protein [Candidatus Nitrosocosmicus sp.]
MRTLKKELEKIAEDAITDCYDEYEQIAGWCAYLQSIIELPCKCLVGQKEVILTDFDVNNRGSCVLAVIRIGDNEFKVAAETVTISDKMYSKYLEAYKEWL